ncbi:serine hydrolase [Isoptericola variabilis]|uniref:Beta-lactamase n=1 Tax=Isoptericola variabilis (strain 225) TaxID=743718 RepID=F6FUK2_ISOV2|nr:serine hydrolase domain-containing protein [Isoptericola variabilis]AEG45429.1 beta-lactamase [Isoptericola variabilis 225]TWH31549.1 CubicO group peptidase (beta-lactamase class C family) [Isoptericola variabilis J7]
MTGVNQKSDVHRRIPDATAPRRLPRATPESQGVDPEALRGLVGALDGIRDVHSLMVLRHGHVVAEGWWHPYRADEPHVMFSVSKTFTAVAVGLAVAEGLLGVDDRVVDLLPGDAPPEPGEHLAAMRVRHLLTMTSGHGTDTMNFTLRNLHRPGASWARDILAAPVTHEPGTRFVYNTGATYLLSAILHRLTGERLLDYLTPRLLAPLGITGATWEQDPRGIDVGGYGLAITTEDLAAFGQLLLQRGRWGDAQLVPAAWVDELSAAQVDNGPHEWLDWRRGYGYQVWRCRGDAYRADGAFGQFAVVWPEHDAVVVLTSGTAQTNVELEAVFDHLEGAFTEVPDAGTPAGGESLVLEGLAVHVPDGAPTAAIEPFVAGSRFVLEPEVGARAEHPGGPPFPMHSVAVHRRRGGGEGGDAIDLVWTREHGGPEHVVRCGVGHWVRGTADLDGEEVAVAGAAAWTEHATLTLRLLRLGTPFALDVALRFGGDGEGRYVEVAVDQNVSFGPTELLRATGIGSPDA